MKTLRPIPLIFALLAVCSPAGAQATDESAAESVRPDLSAEVPLRSGDDRQATLGDIRHFDARSNMRMTRMENRMNERMDRMETQFNARMERLEDRMTQMFTALLAVMIALYGLPQLPGWWSRLRASGKTATMVGIALATLAVASAGAAIVVAS